MRMGGRDLRERSMRMIGVEGLVLVLGVGALIEVQREGKEVYGMRISGLGFSRMLCSLQVVLM